MVSRGGLHPGFPVCCLSELGQDGGGEEKHSLPMDFGKSLKMLLLYVGIGINLIFMLYFIS